jgi:hypothetical protein
VSAADLRWRHADCRAYRAALYMMTITIVYMTSIIYNVKRQLRRSKEIEHEGE